MSSWVPSIINWQKKAEPVKNGESILILLEQFFIRDNKEWLGSARINVSFQFSIRYTAEVGNYSAYLPIVQKMIDSVTVISPYYNYLENEEYYIPEQNITSGILLHYPSEWELTDRSKGDNKSLIVYSPSDDKVDRFREFFNASIYDDKDFNIQESMQEEINNNRQLYSYAHLFILNTTNIDDIPFHRIMLNATNGTIPFVIEKYWFFKNNKVYSLKYAMEDPKYSSFYQVMQNMIDSFTYENIVRKDTSKKDPNARNDPEVPGIKVNSPNTLIINPQTNKIYIADRLSALIHVMNGRTDKIISNITIADSPIDMSINPETNRLYVTTDSGMISIIDGNSDTLLQQKLNVNGVASEMDVDPDNHWLFVLNGTDFNYGQIAVFDERTSHPVADIPLESGDAELAVNQITNTIYIGYPGMNKIQIIEYYTNKSGAFKNI